MIRHEMNLTSVFVSGVSGATLGAKVDTAIGAWFGGVGAIPGAIIGGAVGGICGFFWCQLARSRNCCLSESYKKDSSLFM